MNADVQQQVRALAIGRIVLGAGFLVAPGPSLQTWVGKKGDTPASRLLVRMVGGRDVALGVGTLLAVRHGAPVRGWLEAGALSDGTDFVASLLASRHLPKGRVLGAGLSAVGAVVLARRLIPKVAPTP
ncbi:MAG: hypothetical protein ACLGI2_17890 [Acidimicrobiia bacterium]